MVQWRNMKKFRRHLMSTERKEQEHLLRHYTPNRENRSSRNVRCLRQLPLTTCTALILLLCLYVVLLYFHESSKQQNHHIFKNAPLPKYKTSFWSKFNIVRFFGSLFSSQPHRRIRKPAIKLKPIVVDTQFYSEAHLVLHSIPLHLRAVDILGRHNCSNSTISSQSHSDDSLILCKNTPSTFSRVTLLTTMYHDKHKQFIFNNTLYNWAQLQRFGVHPILYLSDDSMIKFSGQLIADACAIGWTVVFAPKCNKHSYPVMRDMLMFSHIISPATWYVYANGDILFGRNLVQSLEFLQDLSFPTSFAVARRRNAYIEPNATLSSLDKLLQNGAGLQLHPPTGMDCFAFRRTFPFIRLLPLVIGRPLVDNYLVWFSLMNGLCPVDITKTVTCVHQAVAGFTLHDNSHLSSHVDMGYNRRFMKQKYVPQSFIDCIPHETSKLYYRAFRYGERSPAEQDHTISYEEYKDSARIARVEFFKGSYDYIQLTLRRLRRRCGRRGTYLVERALRKIYDSDKVLKRLRLGVYLTESTVTEHVTTGNVQYTITESVHNVTGV